MLFRSQLIKDYDVICLETLKVKNMVKNHNLALAINDCCWGMFRQMLEYKVKDLRVIGRFEPSSKMCSCGVINNDLKLSDRHWTCSSCNTTHDRDVLAANNIKKFGLRASTLNANVNH